METLTYKQTIDVKGLHSIPRSLSDNILRIPQNGVLIPVNNERIFVGSAVSLIEKKPKVSDYYLRATNITDAQDFEALRE